METGNEVKIKHGGCYSVTHLLKLSQPLGNIVRVAVTVLLYIHVHVCQSPDSPTAIWQHVPLLNFTNHILLLTLLLTGPPWLHPARADPQISRTECEETSCCSRPPPCHTEVSGGRGRGEEGVGKEGGVGEREGWGRGEVGRGGGEGEGGVGGGGVGEREGEGVVVESALGILGSTPLTYM